MHHTRGGPTSDCRSPTSPGRELRPTISSNGSPRSRSTAEQSGFDTVFVMDHFFQLPLIGPPELEMFEAYTLLGAIAARTQTARLGTLVTGVTYRNPALLAKAVTALDVISNGRALLGIGAAWYDTEHEALDVRFPPMSERFERLEDALHICRAMFTERQTTVAGRHHSVTDAWNSPAPVTPGGPPILVGGSGERKTFGLAAKYADELNSNASFVDLPRKIEALDGHLDALGRDRSDITVTCLGTIVTAPTHDEPRPRRWPACCAVAGSTTPTQCSPTLRSPRVCCRASCGATPTTSRSRSRCCARQVSTASS